MNKRVVSLTVLFFWLASGFGFPAVTGSAAAPAPAEDVLSRSPVAPGLLAPRYLSDPVTGYEGVSSQVQASTPHLPHDQEYRGDGLAGGMSLQAQTSTASPSPDRDYDGLTDDVEKNGWWNAMGFFKTDPLDPDSDDDGLTDGEEKLYDTDPLDDHSPGIYVEYESHLKTRQYSAKDPHSVQPWGWQQYGDRLISLDALVVRRGTTFSVGGPADATIVITKSLSYLDDLTVVQDACTGRWRISVEPGSRVGKYEIALHDGDWSESLNLYVIFGLPTPTSSFTQDMIDTFLYDDDPDNLRDEVGVNLGTREFTHDEISSIPEGAWVSAGYGYRFELQSFEPFVFEEHVIGAINGYRTQWYAARALVEYADRVTRFNYPRFLDSSWKVLHYSPQQGNQCSNIAGLLTAFERSAGIPARPFFVDWIHRSFDHSTEIWMTNPDSGTTTWWAARGYNRSDPEPEDCVQGGEVDCAYGCRRPQSRSGWGYAPWHSNGSGIGSVVAAADEGWVWGELNPQTGGAENEYRWPSWDWDAISRKDWFDTLFVPYWRRWGWREEPEVTGSPPSHWPRPTDYTIGASPGSQAVSRENPANYTVILSTSSGFSNIVDLYVTQRPAGTTFAFESNDHCVPHCSRTLVITPTSGTALDTHTLTIQGESGGLVREIDVALVVTDFTIDASPDSQTVRAGDSTDYTVSLEPRNGFDDTVDMSVEGLPSGATADFQYDDWGPPYNDNTLSVSTATTTPAGDYTLTIRGEVGELVHQTTVQLSVTDFSIDADAPPPVAPGGSTNCTVSLTPINGFDDTVNMSVEGLPSGATADFEHDPWGPPYDDNTLTINTSTSTPTGTHTLTVNGDSGPLHHETSVALIVDEGGATAHATSGFSPIVPSASIRGVNRETTRDRGTYLPVAVSSTPFTEVPDDGQTGLVVRGVDDYGVDLDGDSYFDQLVIEMEVDAARAGTYWMEAELGVDRQDPALIWTGGVIAATVVRADLAEGTNRVQLLFEGLPLSAARVDGPYVLKYLSVTDVDNPTPEDFASRALGHWRSTYTTAAYRAYDFQNRGAMLSGTVAEGGLDADGDARYESLTLNVGLDIREPGTYTVQGDLYDGRGKFVARATWTGSEPPASLRFDALPGTVGPYTLEEIYLLDADDEIIDSIVEAYTTRQVIQAEGRTHIVDLADSDQLRVQGILTDTYSDYGVDLDGDGLYDLLAIEVPVEVEEAGEHRLEGWLEAADGRLISWAGSEPVSLAVGTHAISLAFSGLAIHVHNTDGPFTLVAVKLLRGDGYEVLDEVDVATTTSAYTRDQFESLPYLDLSADQMLLFEDHMEDGEGDWTADPPWALTAAQYRSPIHAWTDSPGGDYGDDVNASLVATVPITAWGLARPVLQFRTCYALETDYDHGYVEVSADEGVTWVGVATYTGSTVRWSSETMDLGVMDEAETLQVRFRLDTDPGTVADGWYVDDVVVYLDNDLDDDGIPNDVEVGDDPTDPVDTDGDGTPDYVDDDADGDGIPDAVEAGEDPADPVDTDGDGRPDYVDGDADGDGIPDAVEAGDDPTDPVDTDGDGRPDYVDDDADGDGIPDAVEAGDDPTDPVDTDGDGRPDYADDDADGDGVPDAVEAGEDPGEPVDTDGDDRPDYLDDDSDGDGLLDTGEWSEGPGDPLVGCTADDPVCFDNDVDGDDAYNYLALDSDGDGIPDAVEAGEEPSDPVDTDGDGVPDWIDTDSDGDGIPDAVEAGEDPADPVDTDGDDTPDYLDDDADGDGIPDAVEAGEDPTDPVDTDGDDRPDYLDDDADGDGLLDTGEWSEGPGDPLVGCTADDPVCFDNDVDGDGVYNYLALDSDGDGIPDAVEVGDDPAHPVDTDGDGVPDWIDTDSDGDGAPDRDDPQPTVFNYFRYLPLVLN